MVSKEQANNIATIGMVFFGLLLFILSAIGFKYVGAKCNSKKLRGALTAILALGAGMTTLGISYWVCVGSTDSCYQGASKNDKTGEIYFSIAWFISAGLIAASSIIFSELGKRNKDEDDCGGTKLTRLMFVIMFFSAILLISSSVGVWYAVKGISADLRARGTKKKVEPASIFGTSFPFLGNKDDDD